MEVSIIVNILKTDREARLDALCDVEDYEYSKRNGLPVPPNLRGWDFRLRLWTFYWLYDDRFDFKEKINKIITSNKNKKVMKQNISSDCGASCCSSSSPCSCRKGRGQ